VVSRDGKSHSTGKLCVFETNPSVQLTTAASNNTPTVTVALLCQLLLSCLSCFVVPASPSQSCCHDSTMLFVFDINMQKQRIKRKRIK